MSKFNCMTRFLLMVLFFWTLAGGTAADGALTPEEQTRWETLTRPFMKEIEPDPLRSITPEERAKIHANVDAIVGDMSNPESLIGGMAMAISFDAISRGGTAPTTYPFRVSNNEFNDFERDRKTAAFAWAKQLSQTLGFPVVVQRQADKYIYVEFGDPDAPEMVMASSHLDSPTDSLTATQLARWRGPDDKRGAASAYHPNQYKTPYIKDGWLYGTGVQDDSGPTIATLFAAKVLMDAGLPMDRRIRIVLAGYEDRGPGTPTVANTLKYMSIPYYTANPYFYDNWAYKSLNREEMPIAAFTADSNFPIIIGNSVNASRAVSMSLVGDSKKSFRLLSGTYSVTERAGDETLVDIAYGAGYLTASQAKFTIDMSKVSITSQDRFIQDLEDAATAKGWSDRIQFVKKQSPDSLLITINTDMATEYILPQYGRNAIVWGMSLLSEALDAAGVKSSDLQLKKAADGITELFFRGGTEDYIGTYMGVPPSLLRNPDNGSPNMTFALGAVSGRRRTLSSDFYNPRTGIFSVNMYTRSMHVNSAKYVTASTLVTNAWQKKGFSITDAPGYATPTLYLSHNNPLTAIQFASYKATINSSPEAFEGPYELLGVSYPHGGVGGTLALDFFNKMNAFGAVFPGEESWWHTPNERMKLKSAIQMTKAFADALLEIARYTGPAGAKIMWADIPGLNANRADLDLLDVTIGTYKDAKGVVPLSHNLVSGSKLLAATSFDIPMFRRRGYYQLTDAQIAAQHNPKYPGITKGSQVYLDPSTISSAETFVLPMRLEFKVAKPDEISDSRWQELQEGNINDIERLISFNILNGGDVVPLTMPEGANADMFYFKRVSVYDPDALYISVNIAIKDDAYAGVSACFADSKTDLYSLNPTYLASNPNPFPERGTVEKRGFFVFGDGSKNARFSSPDAIFVTLSDI